MPCGIADTIRGPTGCRPVGRGQRATRPAGASVSHPILPDRGDRPWPERRIRRTGAPNGPAIDPTEFLEQLKEEHQVLQWEPLPPPPPNRTIGVEQDRNRASLEYLHHHWQLPHTYTPEDTGGGAKGKAVGLFGRLTFRVLGRYLREERDLLSHMVQVNEALERRCDQLTLLIQQLHTEVLNRQVAEAEEPGGPGRVAPQPAAGRRRGSRRGRRPRAGRPRVDGAASPGDAARTR